MAGNDFDPNASKYKCCCGCWKIKGATRAFGLVDCFLLSLFTITTVISYVGIGLYHHKIHWVIPIPVVMDVISLITLIYLFQGLRIEKPSPILPHLIFKGLFIVVGGTGFIALIAVSSNRVEQWLSIIGEVIIAFQLWSFIDKATARHTQFYWKLGRDTVLQLETDPNSEISDEGH